MTIAHTSYSIKINTKDTKHHPLHSHKVHILDDGRFILLPDLVVEGDLVDACAIYYGDRMIFTPPGGPEHSHSYSPGNTFFTSVTNDHYHIMPSLSEVHAYTVRSEPEKFIQDEIKRMLGKLND